ncbi:hypothetical protein EDB81DRAFT_934991 [Dactylonectria macrodidyma]|uniref:Uncharacterized protein n=1 Tax=Dactylonectria macrodidyma TaxID=307937 RepID=A0A9P9J2A1_9HYPO|nr:hypothetical protein EDB81DRAFT_934991 [Dactylonectria macrodidyma]
MCNRIGDYDLDLTQPIYASYIEIDGHLYIRGLHNTAEADSCKGAYLVLPIRTRSQLCDQDIFTAEDHLGIRRVVFVSSERRDTWCHEYPLVLAHEYPDGYRMKCFDCNHPGVNGYFVACDGLNVYDIIAHRRDKKPDTSWTHHGPPSPGDGGLDCKTVDYRSYWYPVMAF